MGIAGFGIDLLKLHAGANHSQLRTKVKDHNTFYTGVRKPLNITISTTYKCNLKCAHCCAEIDNSKADVDTDRFIRFIDEIADAGTTKVGFTGGEPLMRKDIVQLLEKCNERKLYLSMVSNGWLVPKYIDSIKNVSTLMLSLDGNAAIHDQIRGRRNFEVFKTAVKAAQEANIPVVALTTLSSMNIDVVDEMADLIDELGIHWMVGLVQTDFTEKHEQKLTNPEILKIIQKLKRFDSVRTSTSYLDLLTGEKAAPKCFAGIGYAVVSPDFKLYPCFPALTDITFKTPNYEGIDLKTHTFGEAFEKLKLYRTTCDTCQLACHMEANYLYNFSSSNIWNTFKLLKPRKAKMRPSSRLQENSAAAN